MNWLRLLIRRFDNWLSRVEGVEVFTDDPRCILRIQTGRLDQTITVSDRVIPRGARAVFLHFWNERMPLIPPGGPDLSYGLKLQRLFLLSMKLIAAHIQGEAALGEIQAVGGITTFVAPEGADGGRASFQHFGFTIFPRRRKAGAFGEFWENVYTWWLLWTYNPVSATYRRMRDMQRTEFWMSREGFVARFGKK